MMMTLMMIMTLFRFNYILFSSFTVKQNSVRKPAYSEKEFDVKRSLSDRRPVLSSGTFIGYDDSDSQSVFPE